MPSLHLLLLLLLGHLLALLALAQPPPPPTTTAITRVVQIFFIAERSYEGLPYTLLHRVSASLLSIDTSQSLTTLVLTSTRIDQRSSTSPTPTPTASTAASTTTTTTTTIPPPQSRPSLPPIPPTIGHPSTITQGPATFLFTHAHPDTPDQTLINRCSLNGTAAARCSMTHVGAAWYARNPAWNGTFSTYRYNWTSGDRFGFAPVTVTAGIPEGGMGEQGEWD
ncbi:hypothetical protein B0T18DRAFT_433193 [Schizothecium vesticola]|uniref:Uncharacterized protein n=1 Tax=Schizothecium vesticola TaxID=314040 RepID=A0AA40BQ69_9PEZI|nr:hypothetical protein B0T18DRAFT_433193 [Schizothecium vesticola]